MFHLLVFPSSYSRCFVIILYVARESCFLFLGKCLHGTSEFLLEYAESALYHVKHIIYGETVIGLNKVEYQANIQQGRNGAF